MPGENTKTKDDGKKVPVYPPRLATVLNQAQCLHRNYNDKNHAEGLRPDTVREGIEKCVASPGYSQREADPKKLADRGDKIEGCNAKRHVLGDDQQPNSGIVELG